VRFGNANEITREIKKRRKVFHPATTTATLSVDVARVAADASADAPLFGRLGFPSPYFRGEFGSLGSRGSLATSGKDRNPAIARASSASLLLLLLARTSRAGERRFGDGRIVRAASRGSVARRRDKNGELRGD
jgi:hypothetical protein